MKKLLILAAAAATTIITGCSGPSYSRFNYEYQAPPEYTLNEKHKTIASTVKGKSLPRHLETFEHPVEGLTWVSNDKKSNLVLDINIKKTKVYKDVVMEDTQEVTGSDGKKKKVKVYTYPGIIQTPYELSLYDRINKEYISQVKEKYEDRVTGDEKTSKRSAEGSLARIANDKKDGSRSLAISEITDKAKRLLDVKLTEHTKVQAFRIPEKDEKEPRLAQAYQILTTQSNKEGAKQALAIYQAIGTNNKDEKGEDNKDLNEAVYSGLSACHYILGDMAEYERTKELANQTISYSSSVTTSSFSF